MGDCQKYGPFLCPCYYTGPNTGPNLGDPKRDHNFDNPPYTYIRIRESLGQNVTPSRHGSLRFSITAWAWTWEWAVGLMFFRVEV